MARVRRPLTDEQKASRAAYMKEYRRRNPEMIKEHAKRSREKNKDKVRVRQKKWAEANKERLQEQAKKRYLENKDHVADLAMRRTFGISLAQYTDLLASQGDVCAICGGDDPRKGARFHIDHDRSCCPGNTSCGDCVRALLCMHCNVGLGHFRDDVDLLESAVVYLIHHREAAIQRGTSGPRRPSDSDTELSATFQQPDLGRPRTDGASRGCPSS